MPSLYIFYFRLNFTDIYAWEFTQRPGYKFFEGMSTDLVAATHFYNFEASAHDDPLNPLNILKATAQPGDFVVFKLDIDTPAVETPLVEQLLGDTDALSLITDFFYELHFNLQDMAWAWGHGEMGMDLISATTVFRTLREKGLVSYLRSGGGSTQTKISDHKCVPIISNPLFLFFPTTPLFLRTSYPLAIFKH